MTVRFLTSTAFATMLAVAGAGSLQAQDNAFGATDEDNPFDNPPAGAEQSPFGQAEQPVENPFGSTGDTNPFDAPQNPEASPFSAPSQSSTAEQIDATPASPFGETATSTRIVQRPAWDIVRSPSEFTERERPDISTNYAARGPRRDAAVLFQERGEGSPPLQSSLVRPGEVRWASSLQSALESSQNDGRPVLLVFVSEKKRSMDFEEEVAQDAEVAAAMGFFVPVKVDVRENPELAARYALPQTPYAVVLDSLGYTVAHISGLSNKERLLRDLRRHSGL